MKTYIFTAKKGTLKAEYLTPDALAKHAPQPDDLSYIDLTAFKPADLKKAVSRLKKCGAWGVIDPKGTVKDPAVWFFDGASDYIGPGALKTADAKRFKTAASWKGGAAPASAKGAKGGKEAEAPRSAIVKRGIKLPAGAFPSWKSLSPGKSIQTYFLYASLQGRTPLNARFGEAAYAQLHKRFLLSVFQGLQDADPLAWMDTGKDCLFLIPPKEKSINAAVAGCLKMLLAAPLAAIESLSLTIPVNFVFALHYGQIKYQPPGKTGTVVSDAVNHVFHLGAKHAELGRLTITSETPDVTVPETLADMFVSAGDFEGRELVQSRKFSYASPWI